MDAAVSSNKQLRILLETRPALERHAGIPQQTRLLFRSLSSIQDFSVEGLLQSSTHALAKALPPGGGGWFGGLSKHRQIDRLGRVVIMVEQKFWRSYFSVFRVALRRLLGATEKLTCFDSTHFRDFIWRRMFYRSLQSSDFDLVTSADFRVAQSPWNAMHIWGLISAKCCGYAMFPRIDTSDFDVMIAETPFPGAVSRRTRLVIRYHDAIPLLMPHTISNRAYHQAWHYHALHHNIQSGASFVCVSEATRRDLLSVFPSIEPRTVTIHNAVPSEYFNEASSITQIWKIIETRKNARIQRLLRLKGNIEHADLCQSGGYLLIVSTIEPRKNHLTLLSAWERLRADRFPKLKIIIVGSLGWHARSILQRLQYGLEREDIFALEEVPSSELRLLYKHARATVCPSFAEGFDLSGVEAMASGGAVVASDIPVHREVCANAAEYFSPYSIDELVRALTVVINPSSSARRDELVFLGGLVAGRYRDEEIRPKWQAFLAGSGTSASAATVKSVQSAT